MLRGHIDTIEGRIAGWAYDDARLGTSLEVSIYIGGQFHVAVLADIPRPDIDVMASGYF